MVSIKEYVRINKVILPDVHKASLRLKCEGLMSTKAQCPMRDIRNQDFELGPRAKAWNFGLRASRFGPRGYCTYTTTFRTPYANAASVEFI